MVTFGTEFYKTLKQHDISEKIHDVQFIRLF